ncbi:MAG: ABC transporter permease [Terriglobales bacterium]
MDLTTWWKDVRGGVRLLVRRPGFAIAAVLSLALGIGVNTVVFTLVNAVFLRPVPIRDPGRAVAIYTRDARNPALGFNPSSYVNLRDLRRDNNVFSALSVDIGTGITWQSHGHVQGLNAALVNANFFPLLGEHIAPGRNFRPDEDSTPGAHPVAILSHNFWVRQFGAEPGIIGQTLELNGLAYTVVGIAPPGFQNVGVFGNPDVWLPLAMHDQVLTGILKNWFLERRALFASAVARLNPGVSLQQAQAAVAALALHLGSEFPSDDAGRTFALVPMSESNINPNARPAFLLAGALLFAIAALVLLIACANIANLLLVRATERRREFAVRLALGARHSRLMRQLLSESLVLALLGGIVAVGLAFVARNGLRALLPPQLNQQIHATISPLVLLFTFVLALVATLLFGLAPALQATRTAPLASLRDRTEAPGGGRHWYSLRGLLVVVQVAFSLIALVGASLFVHSLLNAQQVQAGFDAPHLVALTPDLNAAGYTPARMHQFYLAALARLRALPAVAAAGITNAPPLTGGLERTTFPSGVDTSNTRNGKLTPVTAVSPGYFQTMGMPLLRGRGISPDDTAAAPMVAVVNTALAHRLWPGQSPIGKRLQFFEETWQVTVVGEVPTVKYASLGEPPQPQVYFALQQHPSIGSILVRTHGSPSAALLALSAIVHNLDPTLPPPRTLLVQQQISRLLAAPALGADLLAVFGVLALLLAAVGTYGVMAYAVAQRRGEIGLRMALGAQAGDILRLMFSSGMVMVGVGVAAGLAIAALLSRGLGSLLYGIGAFDPASFLIAPAVLLVAGAIACWLPARRALRVDPNRALRQD